MSPAHAAPQGVLSFTGLDAATQARRAAVDSRLAVLGLRMEHSLDALDDDTGHAVIDLATEETITPEPGEVLDLAIEWSLLEGARLSHLD